MAIREASASPGGISGPCGGFRDVGDVGGAAGRAHAFLRRSWAVGPCGPVVVLLTLGISEFEWCGAGGRQESPSLLQDSFSRATIVSRALVVYGGEEVTAILRDRRREFPGGSFLDREELLSLAWGGIP